MRWLVLVSFSSLLALLVGWISLLSGYAQPQRDESVVYFENHIRPLLVQQCQSCHGPQKQKGGLRLDEPEWIRRGGDTGKILEPGSPEKSLLFQVVSYEHEIRMPPRGKLSADQIEKVRTWLLNGAKLPAGESTAVAIKPFDISERAKHWCYQPLQEVKVPTLKPTIPVYTPIDAFIQARWQPLQLKPAKDASKTVWLRRVTFDLLGLPPTPEELTAFEADSTPLAYEKVVDRLLARTDYGERWARHWLDLMRYADTLGHEFDFDLPNAWRYRNYVIRALNDDVPYDQFVREHLAGDLLDQPRIHPKEHWNESIQATGFLWLGEAKQAPVDVRQEQADRIDNQIDVLGKAFMGQTIACARCHDHKFDALATRDYYALYGVLKSSRYQQAVIDDPSQTERLRQRLKELQEQTAGKLLPAQAATPPLAPGYFRVDLTSAQHQGLAWQTSTNSSTALYRQPVTRTWRSRYVPPGLWDSGLVSECLEGSLRTATMTIRQRYLFVEAAGWAGRIRVVVDGFPVIRDPIYGGLRKVVTSPEAAWYNFDLNMWQGRQAYVEFLDGGPADLSLTNDTSPGREAWIQIRQMITSNQPQPPTSLIPTELERKLLTPFDAKDQAWAALLTERQRLESTIPATRYALATADGTGEDEQIFVRGNPRTLGEKVPRGFSELFCANQPMPLGTGSGRLALAERLTNPNANPLIARVIVNRVWKHHFGEGIVRSVDDFGHMGEAPSHPELLDYLARWFIQEGWSLKKLHRQMVLSHTYRLASNLKDEATRKLDPQRRWLSHMPVRRLEAETVRDAMLAVAGQLKTGPIEEGIMPYLNSNMQGRGRPSISGPLDGKHYRSIYQNVRRNFLPPLMTAFDFPTPFTAIGRRSMSNTPSQGLTMMNDPLVLELSKQWAQSVTQQATPTQARLQQMYLAAFARVPDADEEQAATTFINSFQGDTKKAWAALAHALFCSKEFRFIP